jgi:hypothetical protein
LHDLLFCPKPRMKSLAELNARLDDQCIAYARRADHPEFRPNFRSLVLNIASFQRLERRFQF